jgi:hypothetical protein
MPLTAEHLESLARMDREILEMQYQAQRLRLWLTLETAFRPDQLRVPAGNGIVSGRWTREGGGEGSGRADDATSDPDEPRIIRVSDPDDEEDPPQSHVEPESILGMAARFSSTLWAVIARELAIYQAVMYGHLPRQSAPPDIPTMPLPPPAPADSFRVLDWKDYPAYLPTPTAPLMLLEGGEYSRARAAADRTNDAIHKAFPELRGYEIHEIQPVQFGGDPRDPNNKMLIDPKLHDVVSAWWARLVDKI